MRCRIEEARVRAAEAAKIISLKPDAMWLEHADIMCPVEECEAGIRAFAHAGEVWVVQEINNGGGVVSGLPCRERKQK